MTQQHRQAFTALHVALHANRYDEEAAKSALYGIFMDIYFGQQGTKFAKNQWTHPIVACTALMFLAQNGLQCISIYLIPPILTKVQFSFHIRAIHHLEKTFPSDGDPNKWLE